MLEVAVSEFHDSFDYTEMVRARDALPHTEYFCPYCGVRVSRRKAGNGNIYFVRFRGEPLHQNVYCQNIVRNNYTIDEFNYDAFFQNVFKEAQRKKQVPGGLGSEFGEPDEPGTPAGEIGSNGQSADNRPEETGGVGGSRAEGSDKPGDGVVSEGQGLADEDVIASQNPKKRVTSLVDLYKCGLHELPPDTMLGQHKLSDVLISKQRRAAKLLFDDNFDGKRVIQAWPEPMYNGQKNGLIFRCAYHNGKQWNSKRLVLLFEPKKKADFKKEYRKIWNRVTTDTGATKSESTVDTVFLAGNWERVDKPQCASWCYQTNRCESCSGLYKTQFRSPHQLLLIKKKG